MTTETLQNRLTAEEWQRLNRPEILMLIKAFAGLDEAEALELHRICKRMTAHIKTR